MTLVMVVRQTKLILLLIIKLLLLLLHSHRDRSNVVVKVLLYDLPVFKRSDALAVLCNKFGRGKWRTKSSRLDICRIVDSGLILGIVWLLELGRRDFRHDRRRIRVQCVLLIMNFSIVCLCMRNRCLEV